MELDCLDNLDKSLENKLLRCQGLLRGLGRIVVAFSAGVDSTFLLALAARTIAKENIVAGMGISPSVPDRERQAARRIAAQLGVELVEVETDELSDVRYASNPNNRCFHCKSELYRRLKGLAEGRGQFAVASGANADDVSDFRPGLQAGEAMGVRNPLLEAGLTKDEIRRASRAMGLETWDKPAMACLASRAPYGSPITAERLARIERAEYVLNDLGFRQCRVRDHETLARIEVPAEQLERAAAMRDEIVQPLKDLGYIYVTLDLQGFRSGSMNESLGEASEQARPAAGDRKSGTGRTDETDES
jgi:uncharacterized protein